MRVRKIYQCSYCRKLLINNTQMGYHETICFRNPSTKSCATCIFFSRHLEPFYSPDEPYRCFAGKFSGTIENPKPKLKTRCRKWQNYEVIEEYDLWMNYNEVFDPLFSGDVKKFKKSLAKVIAKKEAELDAWYASYLLTQST